MRRNLAGRDFIQDMEAHLTCKTKEFCVTRLALWQELIEPQLQNRGSASASLGIVPMDVEAAEEAAVAATYMELKARVARDEQDYVQYRMNVSKAVSRRHILQVQHHKAQNAKGALSLAWFARARTIAAV